MNPTDEIIDFKDGLLKHTEAYAFIKEHKPYKGFMKYGWISKAILLFGGLVSLMFIGIILEWFEDIFSSESGVIESTMGMLGEVWEMFSEVFLAGGLRYFLLIIFEILIFYCAVNILNVLTGDNMVPKRKDFQNAFNRMIKVAFRSFILETILSAIISMVLNILGLGWISFLPVLFVQAYYMGFAFFDNYNEQFGFTVKESAIISREYMGALMAIGLVAMALFKIPVLGALIAPLLAMTTMTLYMFDHDVHHKVLERHLVSDGHLDLSKNPIKEKQKLKS